jgi:hypothetical protein
MYGLRYPALRTASPENARTNLKIWSSRQLAVYETHGVFKSQTRWIILGVPPKSEFDTLVEEHLRKVPNEKSWLLHADIFGCCIAHWKTYLATLNEIATSKVRSSFSVLSFLTDD